MRHAGDAEQIPVVALDGRLVAHRQRRQHAGRLGVGHVAVDGVAQVLAQAIDRAAGVVVQFLGHGAGHGAHRAAGTQPLLEQPQLEVEAVRVERAMRLPQPHREAPALAGAQVGHRAGEQRAVVDAAVPA